MGRFVYYVGSVRILLDGSYTLWVGSYTIISYTFGPVRILLVRFVYYMKKNKKMNFRFVYFWVGSYTMRF